MICESLHHLTGDVCEEAKPVLIEVDDRLYAVHAADDRLEGFVLVAGPAVSSDQGELTVEQRRNLDMHHTLALIHGFNEMAIKATTLGEKSYYRMARDAAEARFTTLGGKIDRIEEHAPLLVIPGHVPEVRFDVRDIELMRECVARYDAEKTSPPGGKDR